MTSFAFKIPVKINRIDSEEGPKMKNKKEIVQLFGKPRPIDKNIVEYLIMSGLDIKNCDQLKLNYPKAYSNNILISDDQKRSNGSKELIRSQSNILRSSQMDNNAANFSSSFKNFKKQRFM